MLSSRGKQYAEVTGYPWRYAPRQTYDREKNPDGLISLAIAENLIMRPQIAKFINEKVKFTESAISYGPKPLLVPRLLTALSSHFNKFFSPSVPVTPEHIVTAVDATSIGSILGLTLADPGDAVLVSRPIYGRFELDYGLEAGVNILYADTDAKSAFEESVVERFEEALVNFESQNKGRRVRAVLLANPNNPVGKPYPRSTLQKILRFCSKHNLHLISDEVYALCTFDTAIEGTEHVPFTSVLSLLDDPTINPELVHVLYGFSKDFASGGLCLGFLITRNEQLRKAVFPLLRFHNTSGAALQIATAILEDEKFVEGFVETTRSELARSYRFVTRVLEEEGIEYVRGGNAGFFVYINLSPFLQQTSGILNDSGNVLSSEARTYNDKQGTDQEIDLAQRLLDGNVVLHPGEEHNRQPGWFRLVFSQSEEVLSVALRRLVNVLKG
ncbi:1-aminocyclopropane-1-carboxylate synthase [Talaromyces proteolyticus]|uniref:1-aminocyclopropane-1-carboxylate synthase n=1 Tax=Talaromyces proteolyticus TaxID=1131652 RepID=A0AAD4Q3D9_9EURO|nr:1-aminocyclopropane-1-carboxylate synthase [Talaromyces proteolyticus]KAH8701676.1 1-aminocyclopropane-1-carboxylate synthase [Talaromyces proteolyticus]